MKLVLASKSPRRSEILKNAGIDFTVRVADADETIPNGTKPCDAVVFLAARKAMAVERADDETVLGADTVVVLDDKILGKPKDREDAFNMIKMLSGRVHSVFTGVCAIGDGISLTFAEETKVEFYHFPMMKSTNISILMSHMTKQVHTESRALHQSL